MTLDTFLDFAEGVRSSFVLVITGVSNLSVLSGLCSFHELSVIGLGGTTRLHCLALGRMSFARDWKAVWQLHVRVERSAGGQESGVRAIQVGIVHRAVQTA